MTTIDEDLALLRQLNHNIHDSRLNKLKELLLIINEEIFYNELPIEKITIEISDRYTRNTHADTLIDSTIKNYRRVHSYKITFYKRSLRRSWDDITSALEHECLHIFMHHNKRDFDDKDSEFIYMCGRLDIVRCVPDNEYEF